jgi:hypothetical protein
MIQFSYRLETFVLFGICGAVIAGLVLVDGGGRRWLTWLLLPIVAFSVIGAAVQRHDAPEGQTINELLIDKFAPFSTGDFADAKLRLIPLGTSRPPLLLDRTDVRRGRIAIDVRAAPGDLIHTTLVTPARLVDVEGARVIGRWPGPPAGPDWQTRWGLVLQVDDDATSGRAHIVVEQARSLPVVAGRIISLLGVISLATIGAALLGGALRRRRSGQGVA